MAFTPAEIEEFIQALHKDAALRDRVRDAILDDDFRALPGIVRSLGERIEELAEADRGLGRRMDQLTERMDRLAERMDQLAERMDQLAEEVRQLTTEMRQQGQRLNHIDGRVGNLEGRWFEHDYRGNLPSRLGKRFRPVRPVILSDVDAISESGVLSEPEWDDVLRLDAAAFAKRRRVPDSPELLVAMGLSIVVDVEDVARVHRRAEILRRLGLQVEACVDGESILSDARVLAEQLGVVTLVSKEAA